MEEFHMISYVGVPSFFLISKSEDAYAETTKWLWRY